MRPVGALFFPWDQRLPLGTEGYRPRLLQKVVRQGAKAPSFREAAEDLQDLAEVTIRATHVRRWCERLGQEWRQHTAQDVQAFQARTLPRGDAAPPKVAAVMLDGGRYQTRAADQGRGGSDAAWKETKVACCQTRASAERSQDPQPESPRKFLEPTAVAPLVSSMHARGAAGRSAPAAPRPARRQPQRRKQGRRVLVKTVVATTADTEGFGWQVATEGQRRCLDQAARKACGGDGANAVWALVAMHWLPAGFIAILDFVHLLTYLYAAAGARKGKGSSAAWTVYDRGRRWAWSGPVDRWLAGLRAAARQLGPPPEGAADDDPRQVVADALG